MAEFKPIETQEALDAIIQDRLKQQERSIRREYDKHLSPDDAAKLREEVNGLRAKQADHAKELADRDAKIKSYETASVKTRVCIDKGLPLDLANRLNGETAEEIAKDADTFAAMMGNSHRAAPMRSTEPNGAASSDNSNYADLRALANGLVGRN